LSIFVKKIPLSRRIGLSSLLDCQHPNNQFYYSSLLKNIFVRPTAETKILRHGFTENTIQKVYLMSFTVTNEVKIIMFQFKVVHNVLPTRATLYRDGISESLVCNLCNAKEKNVASPAYELHCNSRSLYPVSRLIVPKNNNVIHKQYTLRLA